MCKRTILFVMMLFVMNNARSQQFAQKTNLLYWATSTPNLGVEFSIAKQWSMDITLGYNALKLNSKSSFRHWLVEPELRYWLCQSFEGHFVGLHSIYAQYNVGYIPFIPSFKENIYKGNLYGGGFSYGYHMLLGSRWGLELVVGAGFLHIDYDKYTCKDCMEYIGHYNQNYFGITKAGISITYIIE